MGLDARVSSEGAAIFGNQEDEILRLSDRAIERWKITARLIEESIGRPFNGSITQ
jgi:hypothetical protein